MATNRKQRRLERQFAYRAGYHEVTHPTHRWPKLKRGGSGWRAYDHGYEKAMWDTGWFADFAKRMPEMGAGIEQGYIPNYGYRRTEQ